MPHRIDDDRESTPRSGVVGTTQITFFVLEMGDRTQIATAALAAKYSALFEVIGGATLGMMLAKVPATRWGEVAAKKCSLRTVRWIAAAIFLLPGPSLPFGFAAMLQVHALGSFVASDFQPWRSKHADMRESVGAR